MQTGQIYPCMLRSFVTEHFTGFIRSEGNNQEIRFSTRPFGLLVLVDVVQQNLVTVFVARKKQKNT